MKSKKDHPSFFTSTETLLARFCTSFIEAGWIAAVVLSALFMNIYTHRMFEPDKAALIRSIAILMFVAWLIKTIERRALIKSRIPTQSVGKSTGQSQEARSKYLPAGKVGQWFKYSLLLPAGLYFSSYLISSLTSVLPANSFWGSYDRMQGLYTTLAYFVIFILAATHIKTKAQIERLITAIILTSIPIMCYGLIQKLGKDPVPWQMMDPRKRISSTMGNPIFFAAYLIVVVPLILSRLLNLLHTLAPSRTVGPQGHLARLNYYFKIGFYGLVLLLQIVSIILTQSRGPLLGLVSGVVFFFFIYAIIYKNKALIWTLASGFILGSIFVVIFNLPNTPLEPLKKVPYLERFGRLNPSEGSARVRIILWGNAIKLMRDTYNPTLPHPELVGAAPWRFILGYGPETIGNTFYRYHTGELVGFEGRTVHADNCHNILFNSFVNQGVFGLITFLFLISGTIYLGLRMLKGSNIKTFNFLLILGIISAIIAHFIEALFGLRIVVTHTHFWLFVALLYAISRLQGESQYNHGDPSVRLPRRQAGVDAEAKQSFGQFLISSLFWTYLGVTIVIVMIVVEYDWPSLGTNIKHWITGTYLYIFSGILLGAVSLPLPPHTHTGYGATDLPVRQTGSKAKSTPKVPLMSSFFNLLGYLCLIIAAFSLIVYSNFNAILADGYYKFSFSADNESEKISKVYRKTDGFRRKLLYKKARAGLSPTEEKQLQSITKQIPAMLWEMFKLRLNSIAYFQRGLQLTPHEKTYLNGMGRNFLELAKIWEIAKGNGWVLKGKDMHGRWVEIDMNAPGLLSESPSMKEIMDFRLGQYYKFNHYDFAYCCLTSIREAYLLEPTNYERRLAMAQVYRYWAQKTQRDGRIQEFKEYFKKAMEYYQKADEASPAHPVVDEYMIKMQKDMGKRPTRYRIDPTVPRKPSK